MFRYFWSLVVLLLLSAPANAKVLFQHNWHVGGGSPAPPIYFDFDAYEVRFGLGTPERWRIPDVDTTDIGMTWVANAANAASYTWHDFSCGCEVPLDWDEMVSTLLQGPNAYPDGPSLGLSGPFGVNSFKFQPVAAPGTTIEALELTLNTLSFSQSAGRPTFDANFTFRILGEGEFIPEPSTWLLALCGVIGLTRRVRCRG
jgi:hypothetical protein